MGSGVGASEAFRKSRDCLTIQTERQLRLLYEAELCEGISEGDLRQVAVTGVWVPCEKFMEDDLGAVPCHDGSHNGLLT